MKKETEIKLVKLEKAQVMAAQAYGKEPEGPAWEKMLAGLKALNLLEEIEKLQFYGFNHPDPAPGDENYGYEQWVVLPEGVTTTPGLESKPFPGGLYARLEMPVPGPQNLWDHWQLLAKWREDSPYMYDHSRPYLEELINPRTVLEGKETEMRFNLYMPVFEP